MSSQTRLEIRTVSNFSFLKLALFFLFSCAALWLFLAHPEFLDNSIFWPRAVTTSPIERAVCVFIASFMTLIALASVAQAVRCRGLFIWTDGDKFKINNPLTPAAIELSNIRSIRPSGIPGLIAISTNEAKNYLVSSAFSTDAQAALIAKMNALVDRHGM